MKEWDTQVELSRTAVETAFQMADDMADRIEQLERDQKQGSEDYCALMEKHDALHVKLAKAVEALRETDQTIMLCIDEIGWLLWGEDAVSDIRAKLAELEGK